jgi:NAD(P)-dependent dehydrogenase (short-subunit alcohol dehydrogenase family)
LANAPSITVRAFRAVREFGRIDVLVANAAFQMSYESLEEIPDEEWDHTLATNLGGFFHLAKVACRTCRRAHRSSDRRR